MGAYTITRAQRHLRVKTKHRHTAMLFFCWFCLVSCRCLDASLARHLLHSWFSFRFCERKEACYNSKRRTLGNHCADVDTNPLFLYYQNPHCFFVDFCFFSVFFCRVVRTILYQLVDTLIGIVHIQCNCSLKCKSSSDCHRLLEDM